MKDRVELTVNGVRISEFSRYSVETDIYRPAAPFLFHLKEELLPVKTGAECTIRVNGKSILSGVIDDTPPAYSSMGRSYAVTGRSVMGMVADQYCTKFKSYRGYTLRALAEELLKDVPIVSQRNILFASDSVAMDRVGSTIQPEPGETVFEVLRRAALSRGVLFYSRGNGQVVFGKPKGRGAVPFSLIVAGTKKRPENLSRILGAAKEGTAGEHYQKIIVMGQRDDDDDELLLMKTLFDKEAPLYGRSQRGKTRVVVLNDSTSPEAFGRSIIEQQRFRANQYRYELPGHSQNGRVWLTDELCKVSDVVMGLHRTMLTHSIRYELTKKRGANTVVRIAPAGVAL